MAAVYSNILDYIDIEDKLPLSMLARSKFFFSRFNVELDADGWRLLAWWFVSA